MLAEQAPKELFFKQLRFEHQSEVRVVINTQRKEILDEFDKNNGLINIGDLSDICSVSDYYFKEMNISLGERSLLFDLPKPIVSKVTFDEAISILLQYLCDEVPESPLSIDAINDKLKEFSKLFDESFNCDYTPKQLFLYNQSNQTFSDIPFQ